MRFIRRLHATCLALIVRYLRTRFVLKQFKIAHAEEVSRTPVHMLPVVMARHSAEISGIRAGNLDIYAKNEMVDRKSWQWPFLPSSVRRLQVPILKSSPYNLRRMSRTPVARRAMNIIKGAMISLAWDVVPLEDVDVKDKDEQAERIKIARNCFNHPNNDDSYQSWLEMGLEDFMVLGGFVSELGLTPDPHRPIKMWAVSVDSIRLMPAWTESTPDMPRYVQMTGLKGERGALAFYDDEMMYLKDNPSTDNPFGLGKMEVVFRSLNDLLGIQDMAGRAGSDQVHKTWLWWNTPQGDSTLQIVRRHIQNDLEGQAKISLIAGAPKPEVVEVTPVTIEDLLIPWQEMLIRMVANGFDMTAMALGVEHDVNRAVGEVLNDKDFRTAVVPTAKRVEEGFTRRILHNKLGWHDLAFRYLNLDDPDMQTMLEMSGRMYSMNAITPNEIRKKMRMTPLESKFADLTQFDCMLLNIEAMGLSQDQLADHAVTRQQKQQDQQQQNMIQQPGGGLPARFQQQSHPQGNEKITPGSASKGGQPPSPKPLSLPKFPIQGTKYTARQVARMPLNQMQDVFNSSGLQPSEFVQAMDEQEPGILQDLANSVKDFLQQQLDEEQSKRKTRVSPKYWTKWEHELARRVGKDNKRTNDLSEWLRESGSRQLGKPGTSPGKPGTGPVMRSAAKKAKKKGKR